MSEKAWKLAINTLGQLTNEVAEQILSAGFHCVYFDGEVLSDPEGTLRVLEFFPELVPVSVHAFVLTDTWECDEKAMIKKLCHLIDIAAKYKVQFMTNHPEPAFPYYDAPERKAREYQRPELRKKYEELLPRVFKEGARRAATYGITLTIENMIPHPCGSYMTTSSQIASLVRDIGEPNVGICLDSGHALLSRQSPSAFIRDIGNLLKETHFQDTITPLPGIAPLDMDFHRPPGIGCVPWVDVIMALEEIDYQGVITFELGLKANDKSRLELFQIAYTNWKMFERLRELITD